MKPVLQWMLCLALVFTTASAQGQATAEPPGGAMARYRADRCQPNASGVLVCEDMSGNGYTATGQGVGHTPHVEPARIGGQPAIVSVREESLRIGSTSVAIGSNFTAVVVGQHMGQNAYHLLLEPGAPAGGSAAVRTNAPEGNVKFNYSPPAGGTGAVELTGTGGWNGSSYAPLVSGQPFIAVAVGSPAGVLLYVDKALITSSTTPAWPLSLYGAVADGRLVPAGAPALTVGEAIIYNRALSKVELDGVFAYARRRYGLAYPSNENLARNSNFDTTVSDHCYGINTGHGWNEPYSVRRRSLLKKHVPWGFRPSRPSLTAMLTERFSTMRRRPRTQPHWGARFCSTESAIC